MQHDDLDADGLMTFAYVLTAMSGFIVGVFVGWLLP